VLGMLNGQEVTEEKEGERRRKGTRIVQGR